MSSYDSRNSAQIRLDEMINKYKLRIKDAKILAEKYKQDEDLVKQLNLMINDLLYLKELQDKAFKNLKRVV